MISEKSYVLLKLTKRAQQSQTIHGASPTYHKKLIILEIYQVNIKVVMKLGTRKIFWLYCFWVIPMIQNVSVVSSSINKGGKMKEVRICRKFLCLLWNLQYWSIEHEVSRSKIKRLWNFFDSFLMSLQFCSVFFWFMLPKVGKYDPFLYYLSKIKKLDLLQQRPQFLNAWEHFFCNLRLNSRAREKSIE